MAHNPKGPPSGSPEGFRGGPRRGLWGGGAGLVYKLLICFVFVQDDGANAVAVSAEHVQSRNTDEDIYMLFYVRHNNLSNSI